MRLQRDIASGDLLILCRRIDALDSIGARTLPLVVKQWLASALMRVDYVYVEDCLLPIRDAADTFCWSIQTLNCSMSRDTIEKNRSRLVECIMVLEEELRLCPPAAVAV
jgi:hypothetical protein